MTEFFWIPSKTAHAATVLLALNKPYGCLSQFTREVGSRWRTLAELKLPGNVYPLGRLDADSEGLLLLTDERDLNAKLLSPENRHPREYWAQVERIPSDATLEILASGVVIGGQRTLPAKAWKMTTAPRLPARHPPIRLRKNIPAGWIALELYEGKNRQVRRMTAAVGHPTLRLIRARVGSFWLGELAAGNWRELSQAERASVFARNA